MVGSLMHLMVASRPDLAFAVGQLARKMQSPTERDLLNAKRVLRYVKGSLDLALLYPAGGGIEMKSYADSDFAGDIKTRKSTSGNLIIIGGPVSWKSERQHIVALSSTEAEYVSASECLKSIIWCRSILSELSFAQASSSVLYQDNQSTIALTNNPIISKRTKHIDVRYHFLRAQVKAGVVTLQYCPTQEMLADILTKPLLRHQFVRLRDQILV
jgi:hypothetical protein